jgi:hypothetical protein
LSGSSCSCSREIKIDLFPAVTIIVGEVEHGRGRGRQAGRAELLV